MVKALFVKTLRGFEPSDEEARRMHAKWKLGDEVMLEGRKPRNPRQHRLLFAVAHLVVENSERYENEDMFLSAAKVYAGHCHRFETQKGEAVLVPKSISYASMDQTSFEPFLEKTLDLAAKVLGVDPLTIRNELNEYA